jgi:hypothetical protein
MVVVGGAVVSVGASSGGGVGALVVPISSLVLTGVLGTVVVLVVLTGRDDDGLVGVTGVRRSG